MNLYAHDCVLFNTPLTVEIEIRRHFVSTIELCQLQTDTYFLLTKETDIMSFFEIFTCRKIFTFVHDGKLYLH